MQWGFYFEMARKLLHLGMAILWFLFAFWEMLWKYKEISRSIDFYPNLHVYGNFLWAVFSPRCMFHIALMKYQL